MSEMEVDISIQQNSKKDRFHLIRVPKQFDIKKLDGLEFNRHQILEIEAKEDRNGLLHVYELGAFEGEGMDLSILVKSGDAIRAGPVLSQNFCVSKSVRPSNVTKSPPQLSSVYAPRELLCLPEGLKERFAPIGSDTPVPTKNKKNKRIKSKRKRSDDPHDDSVQPVSKKRCRDAAIDTHQHSENDATCKTKRSKSKIGVVYADCNSIHDDNLMNGYVSPCSTPKKAKSLVTEDDHVMDFTGDHISSSSREKKKKKHSKEDDTTACDNAIDTLNLSVSTNELMLKKKKDKKKKREKDRLNVTVL